MFFLQYETVRKAQLEAQAKQQANANSQAKFAQQQVLPKQANQVFLIRLKRDRSGAGQQANSGYSYRIP